MKEDRRTQDETEQEQQRALEREQLGGPSDYDESGGTGLRPEPGTADDDTTESQRSGTEREG